MSSKIACQGLQSCLSGQKLNPPDYKFSISSLSLPDRKDTNLCNETVASNKNNSPASSWSFLDAVNAAGIVTGVKEKAITENVYVHPSVKYSSSTLTERSLQMCTENLGCETGSNASDVSDDIALLSSDFSSEPSKQSRLHVLKKLEHKSNFPPPLTSITDLGGFQVRPQRADGRLVLTAVTAVTHNPCFHAERTNGRLRLLFVDDFVAGEESEDLMGGGEDAFLKNEAENDKLTDEEANLSGEESKENTEGETGIEKFHRPSRCKEDGSNEEVLLNRERFWVAT